MRVLVLGLGRAGKAAVRFLLKQGARVMGHDADPERLKWASLQRAGMRKCTDPGRCRADFAIVSPGIPPNAEVLRAVRRSSIPLVDELDFASLFVPGKLVAVTGTNGKSTTAALCGAALEAAGLSVFTGGNLSPGEPLSAGLMKGRKDCYVVEVSSFQLERARWLKPDVAMLLNVSPDHLNRHRTMARYAECKYRLLDRQGPGDVAVLNADDPVVIKAADRGRAARLFFSTTRKVPGAYLGRGEMRFDGEAVMKPGQMALRGVHNVANALAVLCACRALGVKDAAFRRAMRTFKGLPHRLETVRMLGGVEWVNSSMTTNPVAGASALAAFRRKVILITGGMEKGLPVEVFADAIASRAKRALLVGNSAAKLARMLDRRGFVRYEKCETLGDAVARARALARKGDTVLFAPAFASFDQFRDFADRGEAFRREVARLGQA